MSALAEGGYDSKSGKLTRSASFSTPLSFAYGTGLSVYQNLLLPAILEAKYEVILATCFWASSASLHELVATLKQLSSRTIAANDASRVKVYICFSSRSALQKILHTSSPDGYIYPLDKWTEKLGLPPPSELPGLDICIKSLFFRPFSVLHSKYLIVDRQKVFLPSCNVSWEEWYECAIAFEGPIVRHVFDFWEHIWKPPQPVADLSSSNQEHQNTTQYVTGSRALTSLPKRPVQTTLLPHPHDSSLRQALWLLPRNPGLPDSPLNETLLRLITGAKTEVILLTPNFTSSPVFTAVCYALINGVRIHLITNRRMMVPEQLATAGVLTEQFVDCLIKKYRRGFSSRRIQKRLAKLAQSYPHETMSPNNQDEIHSSGNRSPARPHTKAIGALQVSYFRRPVAGANEERADGPGIGIASQADKSHIKLTLVDRKAIVLGSGNMDRASWRTSQELGVLIEDQDETGQPTGVVEKIWKDVESGLNGCLEDVFVAMMEV